MWIDVATVVDAAADDCHLHLQLSQESMSLNYEMIQEDKLTNMHGLDNFGHADLEASFLSLLSGPSGHVPCDLQHLLDPKPVPISNQVSPNHRAANGFSAESRVSVLPSTFLPHNMDCQNMISGEVFLPLSLSTSTVNYNNGSAELQGANLSFQKSQVVAYQNTHEKENVRCSLIGQNNTGPISGNSWKLQKYADIAALQKVPVESNFPVYHNGHNSFTSFLRVSCSGISGNLLLSDTGFLGVVCACHGVYMSISKFSEHSGSYHVNPGNAVRMENGETVAHWWKTLSKSGIWALEGHREWDWPEGVSAAFGLINRPVSNMSNNRGLMNQVGPFSTSVSYEQQQSSVIKSKENWSRRNVANGYHEKDRNSHKGRNSLSKYFINNSHGNLQHAAEQQIFVMPDSFGINTEKDSQSTTVKLGKICGNANSFPALPNGFSVGRNTTFIVEGPGVSSNIDLRLGQPPEKSRTLETKVLPAFGSNQNGMHAESPKLFSPELLTKTGNEFQGSKWSLPYTNIASKPNERRGPTQLEHSSHVGGAYGAITDNPRDSSSDNLEMTDLNLMFLSCCKTPQMNRQFRDAGGSGSYSGVGSEKLHYGSHPSKNEKIGFQWSKMACNTNEVDNNVSNAQNHVNKGKEVECAVNDLLGASKPNAEFSKTFKEDPIYFSVLSGESSFNHSLALHEKNTNLYQSTMIADEPHGRDIFNNCWNKSSVSDIMDFNHDHGRPNLNSINSKETTPMGFTFPNSAFVQNATLTWSKEKCSEIIPCLDDESVKMCSVQNMSIISNRDNGPASVRNVQECELIKNPHVQSLSAVAPSVSKNHINLLDSLRIVKHPEAGGKSEPSTICWMGHSNERLGIMTGRSLDTVDCDLPPVERLFLRPGAIECNFTQGKKEQCSQGSSSAIQANCLTEKYDLNGHICCNLVKEGDRSEVATSSFHSKSYENLVGHDIKRAEPHTFLWRDVPRKVMESCSSTRITHQAGSFNASMADPVADAKCFTRFARNVVPLKEHEISNLSSGCSAPDVTQSSIEVNKKDSSTVESGDTRCANKLVLDEGSGNGSSWSSDDPLDNEHCAEFFGSASKSNLINRGPFKLVPRKPSLSLIEEIRLQNSLRSKSAPYLIKRSSSIQEEGNHHQKFEVGSKKRRKTVKWMKLDARFPAYGQPSINNKSPTCSEDIGVNDSPEASENFRKKRLRLNDKSARSKEIQEKWCSNAELTVNLTSLHSSNSLGKHNFYKWMARPIVAGKYGIISNGNPSRPSKIISLRKIFKSAAAKSTRNPYDDEKLNSPAVKVRKMGVRRVKETSSSKKVLRSQVKKGGTHDLISVELVPRDPSREIETALDSTAKGSDDLSYTSPKCKNHGITDCKPGVQLKTKFKEGRKRSLHELLNKENGFIISNSSAMKSSISLCQTTSKYWGKVVEDAADCKVQTSYMNNAKRCSEKHQFENSDTFSCVCGNSDKHDTCQLLECNRFLVKGLRSEADAVENGEKVSYGGNCNIHATLCMAITDGESGGLLPVEKLLTCARTEGCNGRKREGFLHNRAQDAIRNAGCLVPQEQLNAWLYIHRQKPQRRGHPNFSSSNVESDCRKAYTRYKQSKSWKHLVVYKSGIHALGLYTSQFISRGAMVVEYVGEIVGLRVADRREKEYHSGKKLQHKSACYFFRIDKEHIIDATRKGGIARFVNHSCEPNCVAKIISVRNDKKVVFLAERDIYPGEEITYDYHFNHEDEGEKIPCYCNSKNCRRYLN